VLHSVLRAMSWDHFPGAQGVHTPAPPVLYLPGVQATTVSVTLPAGQAYPALQGPVQVDDERPGTAPYRPASHSPVQLGDARPRVDP